jgi:hydrogenase-4 membrane subunit HyfE
MWQTRSGAGAMAVELAGALLLAVAVSDALGLAAASFYLLVLGVPVTACAGLICFARVVDASNGGSGDALGRLQASLATLLVLAIVVGAAIRAPVVPEDVVPGIASGVLAFAFGVLVLQALVALVPARRQRA